MTEMSLSQGRSGSTSEVLAIALRALRAGVATVDTRGRLSAADPRFLSLHRLAEGAARCPSAEPWTEMLASSSCGLARDDAVTLASAWSALVAAAVQGRDGRRSVRLDDGRTVELTAAPSGEATAVVAIIEAAGPAGLADQPPFPGGLVHEINNILGGMLANLYIMLADLEPGHPDRARLEAVNDAALDLRARVRQAAAGNRKGR